MNWLLDRIVAVFLGFVAGSLTPLVKWEIEKRRELRRQRVARIAKWREFVDKQFDWSTFRDTADFSEMRPYLSKEIIGAVDPTNENSIVVRSPIGRDTLKAELLADIAQIERRWKLL